MELVDRSCVKVFNVVFFGDSGGKGLFIWRVMMFCREKGSSVSRSRKFLVLIFSCFIVYG